MFPFVPGLLGTTIPLKASQSNEEEDNHSGKQASIDDDIGDYVPQSFKKKIIIDSSGNVLHESINSLVHFS